MVDLGEANNGYHVQAGYRPCLILSNDHGNVVSPVLIVCPITGKRKKVLPTHVELPAHDARFYKSSTALLEQVLTIDKRQVKFKAATLSEEEMLRIDAALHLSLGIFKEESK
ncbi:type II toxin-antitoxin system PemK/MazF family toxin [Paenibacillus humicus]